MSIYSCKPIGVLAIDVQHQRLIAALERIERLSKEADGEAALDAFAFLRSCSDEHFFYEEQVLAERNYPALAAHTELHKIITDEIERLWVDLQNGEKIGEQAIRRMRSWVLDHINIEDAKFADFLNGTESHERGSALSVHHRRKLHHENKMNITTSINGNIASLRMNGRFEFAAHRDFKNAYDPLLSNEQVKEIQLHMSQIDYIDSAALGMLLIIREKANLARKSISLSSPSAAVQQVLAIANFEKLFTIT